MQQRLNVDDAVSILWLKSIIDSTEKSITDKEKARDEHLTRSLSETSCSRPLRNLVVSPEYVFESLKTLNEQLVTLNLAQDFSHLLGNVDFPGDDEDAQVNICIQIGILVDRFLLSTIDNPPRQSIYKACTIYSILHKCVRSKICRRFRQQLHRAEFPSFTAYREIVDHLRTTRNTTTTNLTHPQASMLKYAGYLMKLEIINCVVNSDKCIDKSNRKAQRMDVIDELCRLIYSRIEYHFITAGGSNAPTNINYLPELLFNYLQETLNLPRICEFIQLWIPSLASRMIEELKLDSSSSSITVGCLPYVNVTSYFLQRISSMIKHVLFQRHYFQEIFKHSNEMRDDILRSTIEHIISFDNLMISMSLPIDEKYIPCLLNDLIVNSRYLFDWWIHYELRLCSSNIRNLHPKQSESPRQSADGLDPILQEEVELLLSIINSLFTKAEMIISENPHREFLARTVIPICVGYMEVLHDKVPRLRSLLLKRRDIKVHFASKDISVAITEWMDVIESAHAVFLRLQFYLRGHELRLCFHDIQKVMDSLQKLRDGFIYEVSQCFIEKILMERTKLASYFIRCVHILSSSNGNDFASISEDLSEAIHCLSALVSACNYKRLSRVEYASDLIKVGEFIAFSGKSLLLTVASSLESKFIQAVRDVYDSVSEIHLAGILEFKKDIESIVLLFPREIMISFRHLENLMNLLIMEPRKYANLRSAILQLTSVSIDPLEQSDDSLVTDQVKAMLNAQGLDVQLDDVLQILNKRLQ